MERYEAYKDSGIAWVGQMPASWEEGSLARFAEILGSGATPSTDNELYYDGGIPWLQVRDLGKVRVAAASRAITDKALEDYSAIRIYRAPFLAIAMYASIGSISFVEQDSAVNQAICAIANGNMDLRYLYYHLLSWEPYLLADGQGGTQKNISQQYVRKLRVLVPALKEQQAIADYLDAKTAEIDALVADCEREVELLREYRKAVITEAVTKGLDPNVPMKDSGIEWIGEIPEHWEAGKLLRHARLESGHTPSKQHPEWWLEEECTIPWVTTGDVHRFRDGVLTSIDDTVEHVSQIGLDNSSARLLPAGTVALSRTASVGFSIVLNKPMASSQDFADWVPDDALDSFYLLYSLRSMDVVFKQLQMGSTHKTIYMPDIMKLAIAFPPLDEQQAIVDYLDAKTVEIDSLIERKQQMADKLREYRKSLISEAVTGKFKVPGV